MNLALYTSLSFAAAAICLGKSYAEKGTLEGMVLYILRHNMSVVIMINLAYNLLFLFGKLIQVIFFGKLRTVEAKNLYDRLLQYILFKIVFVGATLEPEFREVLVWTSWFSILGFMKIFSLLTRDRFEHIATFNPNTGNAVHGRLLTLLIAILLCDLGWFYFCISVFQKAGASALLLLSFECFTLFLDTVQTLVKYIIHLVDISRSGVWEQRGTLIYYTEFFTDTLVLAATLGHYAQILTIHGISLTLIDAILFLHMRMVFNNLREKIVAYRNYRKLAHNMKNRYEDVPAEELAALDDVCAVCHDKMDSAKRLPCSHIFHHSCLRSWLEHHHNCPTCRYSLIENVPPTQQQQQQQQPQAAQPVPQPQNNNNNINVPHPIPDLGVAPNNREEIFRFNGGRWFSWLPTIQVVSERRRFYGNEGMVVPQEMIERVREVFPHVPVSVITEDLLQTNSVEITLENILEGRVNIPITPAPTTTPSPTPMPHNQTSSFPNQIPELRSSNNVRSETQQSTEVKTPIPASPGIFADTFASTPQERQQRLHLRKQTMLEKARKQYLEKQSTTTESNEHNYEKLEEEEQQELEQNSSMSNALSEDVTARRRLFLEALSRRQLTKKDD